MDNGEVQIQAMPDEVNLYIAQGYKKAAFQFQMKQEKRCLKVQKNDVLGEICQLQLEKRL